MVRLWSVSSVTLVTVLVMTFLVVTYCDSVGN